MTRSKIQMIKVFIFLLIFLLERSAVCDGSFRINRAVSESTSVDKDFVIPKKNNAQTSVNEEKHQQNAVLPGSTPILEVNKTVNNITSKQSDGNKTAHITETTKEVSV